MCYVKGIDEHDEYVNFVLQYMHTKLVLNGRRYYNLLSNNLFPSFNAR